MAIDYSTVTEVPGNRVTAEQLARICHRYCFATDFCEGNKVLEVACGAGLGLGHLSRRADCLIGGDCTEKLVRSARRHYGDRVGLCCLDAHELPFRDRSFDVVILYEAIYYLKDAARFLGETHRVLRSGGGLLIATVNKDWAGFNPSPHSTRYFSVSELADLLQNHGFDTRVYGAFSSFPKNTRERVTASLRQVAVSLGLIPKTMRGKEFMKRVLYGRLVALGPEIEDGIFEYDPPSAISHVQPNSEFKIVYAVGICQG